jgi:hypothetical protein
MSLSIIRRLVLNIAVKRGVVCVSSEEASYFASISRAQALSTLIAELQRKLPALQAAVAKTSQAYADAQLVLRETVAKLESARAERDTILGKSDRKLLEAKKTCQLSEQN